MTSSRSGMAPRASADLDVLPESHALCDGPHRGLRRLVRPRHALVPHALDHGIVEAHAVRAPQILGGALRRLEQIHAHGSAREVRIPAALHDVLAIGEHASMQSGLHPSSRKRRPAGAPPYTRTPTEE